MSRYLGHYAGDFAAPHGMTREQWIQQRRSRLKATAVRHVLLRDMQVSIERGHAHARFTQHYVDMDQLSTARKRLTLVQEAGNWKIREEAIEGERLVRR